MKPLKLVDFYKIKINTLDNRAETIFYLADLVHFTIPEMRSNTDHDTLQLNENMKRGLKLIQFVDVLLHVHI